MDLSVQMCFTLVTCCMRLLLNSWCQLAKDMETLLNLMGTEEDPWGLQLKYVEMVTCCIMLFATAVGGHIPDRRSHAQPGHLIARQLLWRVKSRPGGILASDPVGSHSADSPTRIHCHRCCAGATCQLWLLHGGTCQSNVTPSPMLNDSLYINGEFWGWLRTKFHAYPLW